MTVTENQLLKGAKKANGIFKGEMAIAILSVFTVAVFERYISRSDTKEVDKTELDNDGSEIKDEDAKTFFTDEVLKGENNPA